MSLWEGVGNTVGYKLDQIIQCPLKKSKLYQVGRGVGHRAFKKQDGDRIQAVFHGFVKTV
jgi:hypothetical protein